MVPYDESRSRIDEFWKLAFAKGGAALPPGTAGTPFERPAGRDDRLETQETGGTGATPSPRRSRRLVERGAHDEDERDEDEAAAPKDDPARVLHLMVVWFDVLLLDDESLLDGACVPFPSSTRALVVLTQPSLARRALFFTTRTTRLPHPPYTWLCASPSSLSIPHALKLMLHCAEHALRAQPHQL
mgnify:CR=1 FL=1